MILHLVTDEQFTDYAVQQFSALEMNSEFVLIPCNHENWSVKSIDKCTIVQRFSPEFDKLLTRLGQYTAIVFHGLFWNSWQTKILERVPEDVKVAWFFWGGDIYSRHGQSVKFLAPITGFLARIRSYKKNLPVDTSWEIPLELFKRIDYCLTDEREEYEYAKQYTGANFEYLWYTCYSLEETIGPLMNSHCDGSNIWIGNSAATGNNHADILWKLWSRGLLRKFKGEKVIMPLSYGDPWMRNLILKYGKRLLGKYLQALEAYIPRNEYNALMLSCSTMIIGYWEPAAQGNIITAMWLGMRVYLSEKSMTYQYFKRIGCKIYSIEHDLDRKNPDVFALMKQEDIDTNRAVLRKWYSKEEMHKRNLEIVKALS